jgi:L-alanine-DL-glutamate epimerase-like enolase superfamily enzyme
MARLKAESPIPLLADEDLVDLGSVDRLGMGYHGVNVKLSKCGGILAAVRLIHAARARGLEIMVGCFVESSLGISAACQLAPLARWADLDGAALLAHDPFEGSSVSSGTIRLGTGPGLGVRPRQGD